MSWEKLLELANGDNNVVEFINSQKTSNENLVSKVNSLETKNNGLEESLSKFKQGNTLVKEQLGIDQLNADSLAEALGKLKNTKGDEGLKAEIDNLKGLLEKANADKNALVTDYEGKLSNMALTNSLRDLGIGSLAINPLSEQMILNHLKDGATLDGENIVYKNKDGSTAYENGTQLSPKQKLEAMQSSDDWKPFFKGATQSGGGYRENNGGGNTNGNMGGSKQERLAAIQNKLNKG